MPRTRNTKKTTKPEAPTPPAEDLDADVAVAAGLVGGTVDPTPPSDDPPMGQAFLFPDDISVGLQLELEKAGWQYDASRKLFTQPPDEEPISYLDFLDFLASLAEGIDQPPPFTAEFKTSVEESIANPTPPDAFDLADGLTPGDEQPLTDEDIAAAQELLDEQEQDAIVQVKGNFDYCGRDKERPDGPAWEAADELFDYGDRLPPEAESDAFRKEFRLTADEWREIRDFYLHPRDVGDAVHRGRKYPVNRFTTRTLPDGTSAPTGGFSAGLGFFIDWQDGNEEPNGAITEDILECIIERFEFFQASRFSSMETGLAIKHLRDAIAALDLRVQRRKQAGVYGTYKE